MLYKTFELLLLILGFKNLIIYLRGGGDPACPFIFQFLAKWEWASMSIGLKTDKS